MRHMPARRAQPEAFGRCRENLLTCDKATDIIGVMVTPNLNDAVDALAYLEAPLRAVQQALDDGVSFADGVLDKLPSDSHYWAHCVRYHACNRLASAPADGWRWARLANSGMLVARDPLVVRVFKSQFDGPPNPGHSVARNRFWRQEGASVQLPLPGLTWGGDVPEPLTTHLILDWDIDGAKRIVLALSKPHGSWKFTGQPKLVWRRPVIITEEELRFSPAVEDDVLVQPRFEELEADEPGQLG
jgi:hypothetical protein